MDVSELIKNRLAEIGQEQKELARAAGVTDSYVSQLLARRKAPPSPRRTSIYRRMDRFLGLPEGRLAELAEAQRLAELRRALADEPAPLLPHLRELLLARCRPARRTVFRASFVTAPFGELERLVANVLIEVVQSIVRPRLGDEDWLRRLANRTGEPADSLRCAGAPGARHRRGAPVGPALRRAARTADRGLGCGPGDAGRASHAGPAAGGWEDASLHDGGAGARRAGGGAGLSRFRA